MRRRRVKHMQKRRNTPYILAKISKKLVPWIIFCFWQMLLLCGLFTNMLFHDYHCLMFSITQRPSTLRVDNMDLPRQRKDLIFYPQILHYVMRSDTIMSRKNDNYQRLLRVRKKHRKYCGKLLTSKQTFQPSIHFNIYTPGNCFNQ